MYWYLFLLLLIFVPFFRHAFFWLILLVFAGVVLILAGWKVSNKQWEWKGPKKRAPGKDPSPFGKNEDIEDADFKEEPREK